MDVLMCIKLIFVTAVELILFFIGLYYVIVGVFAFIPRRKTAIDKDAKHRFAVLIPAHNEASVIEDIIMSIKAQSYDKSLIDVFVIADGCTDDTEKRALVHGARVIKKDVSCGKGDALKYGIDEIMSLDDSYDVFMFFDADNVLDRDCIKNVNRMFTCGSEVVQCKIAAKNANSGVLPYAYSVWYDLEHIFAKKAPHNLGIGCKISGTGFAIKKDVLIKCPMDCITLAEDLEYTMKLGINNIKPYYAEDSVVYDEKPTALKASILQRCRWVRGITSVQGMYGFKTLKEKKLTLWLSLYGDFLGQFIYALYFVINLFAIYGMMSGMSFAFTKLWQTPMGFVTLNIYLGLGFICALFGLIKSKKLDKNVMKNLFGFLIYMLSWIPVMAFSVFLKDKDGWYHTKHTG